MRRPSDFPRAAFSLIEVALSLALAGFALVGILGALPLALGSGRESIEQTRAASIANTLFSTIRAQPFTRVYYLSDQVTADGVATPVGPPADLTTTSARSFFAALPDPAAEEEAQPPGAMKFQSTAAGAGYRVSFFYHHQPGTAGQPTLPAPGWASQVEIAVSALDHPKDVYRFVSVVANRVP